MVLNKPVHRMLYNLINFNVQIARYFIEKFSERMGDGTCEAHGYCFLIMRVAQNIVGKEIAEVIENDRAAGRIVGMLEQDREILHASPEILYRDDYVVAVHKPSGMLVHRSRLDKDARRFVLQEVRNLVGQHVYAIGRGGEEEASRIRAVKRLWSGHPAEEGASEGGLGLVARFRRELRHAG